MKKNPLVLLLGVSGTFFIIFLIFVYLAMGSFVREGARTSFLAKFGAGIGVIELKGVIMDSKKILKEVERFEASSDIRGVILRINSPGGAVAPSQEIHDAILKLRKKKPVVASFDSVAASGGYYVAVAADKIVTNPGSMTGSIGVIMNFHDLSQLYKWAKVDSYNVKSGKFKDVGNEARPMTGEEKALMQDMIMNVYHQFVRAVADGRKLPVDTVLKLADGRVYTGEQAVKLGLADELGGMDAAVEQVKKLAKISGKTNLVYPQHRRPGILEYFRDGGPESLLDRLVRAVVHSATNVMTENEAWSGKSLLFM